MTYAMHPQATGQQNRLRWVVPSCPVTGCGRVTKAPEPLGSLIDAHLIDDVTVVPGAVEVTLSGARSWAADGAAVREALGEALDHPEQWELREEDADGAGSLADTVTELLGGTIGEIIRSHGGRIAVTKVIGGDVWLTVSGTCAHCPALGALTGKHIDIRLHEALPDLGAVHWVRGSGRRTGDGPSLADLLRLRLSVVRQG